MAETFPLWWASLITIVLLVGIVIACWAVPGKAVFSDAPDQHWWRDLRLWATVLVSLQIGIYVLFA